MNKLRRVALIVSLALVTTIAAVGGPPKRTKSSLSISRLPIAPGESVVGFEFRMRSGRIVQIPDTPIGWNVCIDNDPSWNTTVTGSVVVAAGAVGPSFFHRFLVIEKNEDLGNSFEIRGDIVVTRDFVKDRRIPIATADVTLTPVFN